MNSRQEAKLNMYRATQQHCADNNSILATVPALVTALTAFNQKVSSIISTAQQEDLITKGITVDKALAKRTLCQLTFDTAAPIFAYASVSGNNKLKQEMKFSVSELLKTKDEILAPRCQNIKDRGKDNLGALKDYGLTAAGLDALQTAIDSYSQQVPATRNSAAQKKTLRENIKNLIKETDILLKEQMDKTVVGFKSSNPDFVATYFSNRQILGPGTTTTTLRGTIVNALDKSPVSGATIVIAETGNKQMLNGTGTYEFKPIAAGIYTLNISAPKFRDKTEKDITVKQGRLNNLDIAMDPA